MFNIPNLPSDNIYKFNLFYGLSVFVICIFYFLSQFLIFDKTIDDIYISSERIKFEQKLLNDDVNDLEKRKNVLLKSYKDLNSRIENNIEAYNILNYAKEFKNKTRQSNIKINELELKTKTKINEYKRFRIFSLIIAIVMIVSFRFAYSGYKSWNVNIQIPLNQKLLLEIENLKNNN